MSKFSRLIAPVRQMAAAFFRHDVCLRREQGEVHVVLSERKGAYKPGRKERAERKRQQEVMQVRVELAALLNELPETRTTMRHLVFVEQALAKKGLKVLHKLPLDVLQRAHEQLENLVTNWSPAGLANLRSKMAVAIIDREHMDPDAEADAYRTAAVLECGEIVRAPQPAREHEADSSHSDALAAAYAALGEVAPTLVQIQGELGSASARERPRPQPGAHADEAEISIRVLQP